MTHLSEAAVLGPGGAAVRYADVVGTVEELIGRYRALADVGVEHAIVGLHNEGHPAAIEAFAPVIEAFARRAQPTRKQPAMWSSTTPMACMKA